MHKNLSQVIALLCVAAMIAITFVLYYKNTAYVHAPAPDTLPPAVEMTASTTKVEETTPVTVITEKDFLGRWMPLHDITAVDEYAIENGTHIYRSTYEGVTSVGTWSFNEETKMVTATYDMSVPEAEPFTVTVLVEFDAINHELIVKDEETESHWVRPPAILE